MEVIYETPEPAEHDPKPLPICMIRMTASEALATAQSLIAQVTSKNPNTGRYELYDKNGIYFSIAVSDDERIEIVNRAMKNAKKLEAIADKLKPERYWPVIVQMTTVAHEMERIARSL